VGLKLGFTLREEYKLKVFWNRVLKIIIGLRREDGEDYTVRSFTACTSRHLPSGWSGQR